ncbi:piggyBac transposable element-derived protein 4-like [Stegodyphus dumicola]|uniref:piggyBac transposable element-derived protein 4-like n=1 Tax=Stegodyphus dumicola TaxID=202533 RepID=UPI0015AD00A9|nr:piggyBac transposable element-derived protein 4-like [Stegodyphus dumicola]
MSRKKLTTQEALDLFAELPSDCDSNASDVSSDSDEIEIQERITEVEVIAEEERDTCENEAEFTEPSESSVPCWNKQEVDISLPEFKEDSGPTGEIFDLDDPTPVNLFLSIFTLKFIEHIVFQSNLYATQKNSVFSPLDSNEFLRFLAVNLLMGVKKFPSYRDYWRSTALLHGDYIANIMPVNRFSWILGNFHINDNCLQPKRGEANFDKLYKIRPLLNHLSERFMAVFNPNETQAVDESMIRFKGRSSLKQYMPKKPIKRGYKVWMRCDVTGFACQFEIYTGKLGDSVEKNLGERVVKTLCQPLYGNNHRVFMDNYFSSYNLFRFLKTQNIYACGTVNMNRKYLPKNLKEDKFMSRGDIDFSVEVKNNK